MFLYFIAQRANFWPYSRINIPYIDAFSAEPPRKDGGVLPLSKLFLSTTYAVCPVGLENPSQPFVSKHFNVIDPLRENNNLGRSVSKGACDLK